MYQREVPQYGTLVELVEAVNGRVLAGDPALRNRLVEHDELDRISEERHGAIRLGTAAELAMMRRLFGVMGMSPVGYYDLSVAGIPVHSTAFRPTTAAALRRSPFRVFTSLLRLELLDDVKLRQAAARCLEAREIFTPEARRLVALAEDEGGLVDEEVEPFIAECLETFRWHAEATVPAELYEALHRSHRLIADVVSFRGPHINHLTPRTLDIDAVQRLMPERGIQPKAVIEGPPTREVPILLRQTSFKALEEAVVFPSAAGPVAGRHTARFGEIEQRGAALTPKGRALYDRLLDEVRERMTPAADGANSAAYNEVLRETFAAFPDDLETLRRDGLAYVRYARWDGDGPSGDSLEDRLADGRVVVDAIVYEDFLPVSAAGIFQSNLGDRTAEAIHSHAQRTTFERALGAPVADPFELYQEIEDSSRRAVLDPS